MSVHTQNVRDYKRDAMLDALDAAEAFAGQMAEHMMSGEDAPTHLYGYEDGDDYHHTQHVDKDYNLLEAAQLLDQLSDWEETDSGVWHRLEPRQAVAAQAAWTYGNAVLSMFEYVVAKISEPEDKTAAATLEYLKECDDAEDRAERLEDLIRGTIKGLRENLK